MNALIQLHNGLFRRVEALAPAVIPTAARAVFAGVLFYYFWQAGVSKLDWGNGIFGFLKPTDGAFAQIFPKAAEAVLYDVTQMTFFQKFVSVIGGWAEILLPLALVLGLLTRLSALGMIGFVVVQTLTDIYAHGVVIGAEARDAWFDQYSNGLIMDQRAFWMLLLLVLVMRGGGPLSVDQLIGLNRRNSAAD